MAVVAIGSFLLLALTVFLIARPFLVPMELTGEEATGDLEEKKERLLQTLQDLDMDMATGKLSEEDHRELRRRFAAQAALALKEAGPEASPATAPSSVGECVAPADDDEIEREIERRRRRLEGRGCPRCGSEHDPDDLFCRRCGSSLETATRTQAGG